MITYHVYVGTTSDGTGYVHTVSQLDLEPYNHTRMRLHMAVQATSKQEAIAKALLGKGITVARYTDTTHTNKLAKNGT